MRKHLLTLSLALASCHPAHANTYNATPATSAAVLSAVQSGDVINLAPGTYKLTFTRKFNPPITIVAPLTATMTITHKGSSGVNHQGGTVANALGTGVAGYGASVVQGDHLSFTGMLFSTNQRALVLDRSHDIVVDNNNLTKMRIDGIDIAAGSYNITVTNNKCYAFNTGTTHPDCIQGWSRPGLIVHDVLVKGNSSSGDNQGIFFGNHVRNGVDDGGFDRIVIDSNYVEGLNWPRGITLAACRKCAVTNNTTKRLPGAPHIISITWPGSTGTFTGNVQGK